MLSPREQPDKWGRFKTPAVVSIICLIATLIIAAQGFRGRPAHNGTSWFSRAQQIQHVDQTEPTEPSSRKHEMEVESTALGGAAVLKSSIDLEAAEGQKRVKHVDHLTGTKDLPTGPHKEKEPLQASQHTANDLFSNITAIREVLFGMEVLIINQTLAKVPPQGVLLLFHGCSHSATDWWYPSASCPTCIGLPEELNITKAAIRRNYAVVAFSSTDREMHRCWDTSYPPEKSKDIATVTKAWEFLVEENHWTNIPHFALGGSSGGAFILYLAQRLQLNGLIPVIMSVPSMFLETKESGNLKSTKLPPTFYVSMERDQIVLEGGGVASNMATLSKQGIPVKSIEIAPRALTPNFFAERIESISNATSAAMYAALSVEGCLNATGHLAENPRALLMLKRWQKALRDHVPSTKTMNFNKDESPVFEELNVAWAGHELVSDCIDVTLDWLVKQYNRDSLQLLSAINP